MQDNRIPPQKRPMTEAEMLRRRELRRSAIKKQKRRRTLFLTACALAAVLLIAGIVLLCRSCGRSESSPHDESIYGSFAMSDKSCVYTFREDGSGELRLSDAGKTVTLAGWMENVREVGSNFAVVVLRDFYGTTQVVI